MRFLYGKGWLLRALYRHHSLLVGGEVGVADGRSSSRGGGMNFAHDAAQNEMKAVPHGEEVPDGLGE